MIRRRAARLALLLAPFAVVFVPVSAAARPGAGAAATETQYTLSVTKRGTGSGRITSSPAGIDCPSTCSYDFAAGTQVILTATPATGSSFDGWFSGLNGPCTGNGTCTVTMDQPRSIEASFTEIMESLVVSNVNEPGSAGTVTVRGPGTQFTVAANHEQQGFFDYGATVTLTPTPASGSAFAGWTGDCSGNGACVLVMTKSVLIRGTFSEAGRLKVQLTGKGSGTVTSDPAGINCPSTCSGVFAVDFPLTVTARPAAGSYFAGWSLSGGCGDSSSPCTFDMPGPEDLEVAVFRLDHCLVPNVKRLPLAKARSRLQAYSCRPGKTLRKYSRVKKGRVIAQKPRPHKQSRRGAKVSLVISRGKRH